MNILFMLRKMNQCNK